jgi:hypothetical protein
MCGPHETCGFHGVKSGRHQKGLMKTAIDPVAPFPVLSVTWNLSTQGMMRYHHQRTCGGKEGTG